MTNSGKSNGRVVAIVAMFCIYAMISFVTNLAAPIGTIWGYKFAGNSVLGMMGNMMNFLAYLFMGIPAGNLLVKIGYKKTALWAMAVGFVGLFVQWLSSVAGTETVVTSISGSPVTLNFFIYLLGAFICGFCVCMLNTVVCPMLNLLGGGGKTGNQLLQSGGALNSLSGTLTPLFVGALIGQLTSKTQMSDVAPLLWVAMGVFAVAFIVISFVAIPEPNQSSSGKEVKYSHSPWNFRHTVLGVIGIFFYVGIEIGIPGTLNFYLADQGATGAGVVGAASTIAGAIVAIYWLLMLVGRMLSGFISGSVSTKAQIITVSTVAILLVVFAIVIPKQKAVQVPAMVYDPVENTTEVLRTAGVPAETVVEFIESPSAEMLAPWADSIHEEFEISPEQVVTNLTSVPKVPVSALLLILCGLCTSVMWGGIFNLAVEGLGKYTAQASGIFMMMVVGGGVMPLIQNWIAGAAGYMASYWLIVAMLAYILFYGAIGSKNVNTDIPVDETDDPRNL
ncbi:MAG: MFS transporter [Muribaculaceae bacterium]|nr:MFS transporter [Muribaculaceae bacterium]